jgi:hypothetical protein
VLSDLFLPLSPQHVLAKINSLRRTKDDRLSYERLLKTRLEEQKAKRAAHLEKTKQNRIGEQTKPVCFFSPLTIYLSLAAKAAAKKAKKAEKSKKPATASAPAPAAKKQATGAAPKAAAAAPKAAAAAPAAKKTGKK